MIEIIEGKGVGSGKSYYAATRIVSHIASGGTVFVSSNYGVKWEAMKQLIRDRYWLEPIDEQMNVFDAKDTHQLHKITPQGTDESPVLIVLDEAHMQLNARDWADKAKRPFFDWLTQSRHDSVDLIFITQNAHNIDTQICRLSTYISRCRNMCNFEIPGLGKWPFKQFVINRFDSDGRTLFKRIWKKHDKGIFGVYTSKVMRGSHQRLEKEIPKHKLGKAKRTRKPMKVLIFAALALISFGGFRLWSSWTNHKASSEVEKTALETKQKVVDNPPAQVQAAPRVEARQPQRREPAYLVERETLRSTDSKTYLRTSRETYSKGEMSTRGFVVGISGYVASVMTPDGKRLFIVAGLEATGAAPGASLPALGPQVEQPVIVSPRLAGTQSEDLSRPSPLYDSEVARKRADLARPIGTPVKTDSPPMPGHRPRLPQGVTQR